MSNIKTNDATSKSAGAVSTINNDGNGGNTELKAQLNAVKAKKKELNAELKECERQEKTLKKQLTTSKKSKSKTTTTTTTKKGKKSGKK